MPTRRTVHRTAHIVERGFDRLRRQPPAGSVIVTPYRGYGRDGEMILRARVLVEKRITRATEGEPLWRNVVNTYRRFRTDEVPGARVVARYGESRADGTSDEEGYVEIRLEVPRFDPEGLWHEAVLELPDYGSSAVTHVITPPADAEFAIISDIDDTIVQTGATSLLRMARSVMSNASVRLPFEGVSELYESLQRQRNPIFYVSSSPWNLYELLHDFMDLNGIPHGPMFLQDWGIDEKAFILASHEHHKLEEIQRIVDYYPQMRFVLIGDSGQHDPEIYLDVIRTHPGRVIAAFIRDVTHDLRDQAVARIIDEAHASGVEMLYVADSGEAMEHARRLALIS